MATPLAGGGPLSFAVLGVENMAESLGFYQGIVGMEVIGEDMLRGPRFAGHWRVPPETRAHAVLLEARGFPVGRIMLLSFIVPRRERVRARRERRMIGLMNLNFYVADIHSAHRDLSAKGYEFWWPPRQHQLSAGVGQETGALLEGPDGVILNLIQLDSTDETTRIGRMRKYFREEGATRTGFSPVVTSAHGVRARDKALPIYRDLLGLEVVIDEPLGPADERTHWRFLQGDHPYGKIALGQALNYEVEDLTPFAVAPNIGYLAQGFEVANMDAALAFCRDIAAEIYSPPDEIDLPGLGRTVSMLVRNPGSGALMQLMQKS
ncbi:MAG: VOC family protein [Proteobacteria bacterium]|nr:VOC family protein [Pseudomonadota bacterium]MDA1059048.1 VOC family protein [Pseudomonadota bacterium]